MPNITNHKCASLGLTICTAYNTLVSDQQTKNFYMENIEETSGMAFFKTLQCYTTSPLGEPAQHHHCFVCGQVIKGKSSIFSHQSLIADVGEY